ncbi:ABC transporter substrate-binding protein [Nocardioides pantholopis]|uniref:ABC transporter substrate-binding protein n=1 Tax=Nocardioides pantholopis TaxID=2483798 RepID=UPI0013DE1CD1|nr:ABC transporter substrate-binding protein [Nocardioides pantholopis]
MSNRLRSLVGVTAALALASVAAACGGDSSSADEADTKSAADICPTSDTSGSVTIGMGQPLPVFAPMLLAHVTDAFSEAGLEVKIEPIPTADGLPLLAQGKLDGQLTSYTSGNFNVVNEGVNLKFIAPLDRQAETPPGAPVPGFWARKDVVGDADDLDLTKIKDGLVVGPTGTRGISAMILQNALEPFDMTLDDVQTGEVMQAPDGLVALDNGAVDLAWISAPLEVEAAKNPDLVPVAGYAPGITGTTLLAGPSLLDRPEVAVRVLQVLSDVSEEYLEGDYRENPETVALLAKAQDLPEATVEASLPLDFDPTFSMDGVGDFLEGLQEFLTAQGDLEYDEPLSVDQILDTRFVEALNSCERPS